MFAGDPSIGDAGDALEQTHLTLTATRSVFRLQSRGVQIALEYLSPIEPGDLQRQSIPMAWVLVTARSIDGASHDVSLYLDVSGEWLSGDPSQQFTWAPVSVAYSGGALQAWTMQLAEQQILTEIDNRAQWGTIILATPRISGLSYQSGPAGTVRRQFVDQGVLLDTDDTSYTSIGGDGYPSFGFALDLGQVGSQPQTRQFSLGQVAHAAGALPGHAAAAALDRVLLGLAADARVLPRRHRRRPAASEHARRQTVRRCQKGGRSQVRGALRALAAPGLRSHRACGGTGQHSLGLPEGDLLQTATPRPWT